MEHEGYPYFHINYIHQTFVTFLVTPFVTLLVFQFVFIIVHVSTEYDLIIELCSGIGKYEEYQYERKNKKSIVSTGCPTDSSNSIMKLIFEKHISILR